MQQYSTMANGLAATAPAAVRRRPWTVEEDRVLVQYVNAIGEGSWNHLARDARLNRTGRSCRLRWRNYLRPDLSRGKMTAEEQDVIVHLQSQWGNRWSKIAKQLPGRTDNDVKNFWKTNIQQHKKKRRRRQRYKVDDITAAIDLCSGVDSGDTCTPATTEAQGSSSSNNSGSGGGGTTTTGVDDALLVTQDYGIVAAHQPASMCCRSVEGGHHPGDQQVPGAAAGGTTWSATEVHPELLAASGENFWAFDDYSWSTTQSCLGNNGGTWSAAEFHPELLAALGGNFWTIDDYSWSTTQSCVGNNDSRIGCWDTHTRARQYSRL